MQESNARVVFTIFLLIVIALAVIGNALTDPYVTICQGDTEEYYGLFITVNNVDQLNNTATFTAGTSGSENAEFKDKKIGFYGEVSGLNRYGIRLLHVKRGWVGVCAEFHITIHSPPTD